MDYGFIYQDFANKRVLGKQMEGVEPQFWPAQDPNEKPKKNKLKIN